MVLPGPVNRHLRCKLYANGDILELRAPSIRYCVSWNVCPSYLNPVRAKTVVSYSLVLFPPSKTILQLDRRTGNLVSSVGNQTQAMFRAIFFPFPNPS